MQIQTRLQRLQQQEAKLCLPDIISKLKRQQDQLQAKLQLLTASLTDSKQANACMRSRVESANADNKTQLLAATVSHCARGSHACGRHRLHVAAMAGFVLASLSDSHSLPSPIEWTPCNACLYTASHEPHHVQCHPLGLPTGLCRTAVLHTWQDAPHLGTSRHQRCSACAVVWSCDDGLTCGYVLLPRSDWQT